MRELVFATNNSNKLKEVNELLKNEYSVLGLKQIGCTEDIEETGLTLKDNALIKAKHVFEKYNYSCFADDTGLIVPSLNGAPGVYSARYAGPNKGSQENMELLLKNMGNIEDRYAYFETVVCYIKNNSIQYFIGKCEGTIEKEMSGSAGFGYDPIFTPMGFNVTFAAMSSNEKNKISHRGIAVQKLINHLKIS